MRYTKSQFRDKLTGFFKRHDDSKMHLVEEIANRFQGREEEVFRYLTDLYAPPKEERDKISDDTILSVPSSEHTAAAPI